MNRKTFKTGIQNFEDLVQFAESSNKRLHYFVDKTLFIKEVLENSNLVLLITRPRRFGKTLNMSMLKYFFDVQGAEQNRLLFNGLKIADTKTDITGVEKSCIDFQGQYPVIFISFKSVKLLSFDQCYQQVKEIMIKLCQQFRFLLNSEKLAEDEKMFIERIINRTAQDSEYNNTLTNLCSYLFSHFEKKVILLIDEYDTPLQIAYQNGFYNELKSVMEILLGEALKNNDSILEKAVVTGILRIAGAGLFSSVNNLRTFTILDERFSTHFGFTPKEVQSLLADMEAHGIEHAKNHFDQIREWYNGYQFGNTIVYNPWSTMIALSEHFVFDSYWLNSGADSLLKHLLINSSAHIKSQIAELVAKKTVSVLVRKELRFDDELNPEEHLWTLLLSAGYLMSLKTKYVEEFDVNCTVSIPNTEVAAIYRGIFKGWLNTQLANLNYHCLMDYLLTGDLETFGKEFETFFMESVSPFDVKSDKIESFYHGFMIALIGLCMERFKTYLHSNKQSGLGFYDLVIEPKNLQDPKYHTGIIFEFKRTNDPEKLLIEAKHGLDQIKSKQYATDLQARGVQKIKIMCIAFCGKQLQYAFEDLSMS